MVSDIYKKFKKVEILNEISNETFILIGMSNKEWNGVIEYSEELTIREVESKTKFDSTFLFYKFSPPTYKEIILIEKYLTGLKVINSTESVKKNKLKKRLYAEIIEKNLNKLELNFNNRIEKIKLIQLGQIYGEIYSNILIFENENYTHVIFYSI